MSYLENLTSWKHITTYKIGFLVFIVLLGTHLIFDVYPKLREKNKTIKNIGDYCVIGCDSDYCKYVGYQYRGSNYHDTPGVDTPAESGCLVTGWEMSHFLLHIWIGYYYNIYISLMLGFGYELYEYNTCDCHSGFDLVYNTTGALLGNYFKS